MYSYYEYYAISKEVAHLDGRFPDKKEQNVDVG